MELSGDILPLTIQMATMGVMVLVIMGVLNWRLTLLVAPMLPIFTSCSEPTQGD